jgi:hypothetical protein
MHGFRHSCQSRHCQGLVTLPRYADVPSQNSNAFHVLPTARSMVYQCVVNMPVTLCSTTTIIPTASSSWAEHSPQQSNNPNRVSGTHATATPCRFKLKDLIKVKGGHITRLRRLRV